MKRLFVSLPLDDQFAKVFECYRDANGRIGYLRWIPIKNLHVTVLFIGDVPERRLPQLTDALAAVAASHEPLALVLDRITYAPPGKYGRDKPNMVWAQFKQSEEFDALASDVLDAVEGIAPMVMDSHKQRGRPLIPHVTLARFRDPKNPPRHLRKLHKTEYEGRAMGISAMDLMESQLSREGAQYTRLARFALSRSRQETEHGLEEG
jgi:2'-5' RNA ligase